MYYKMGPFGIILRCSLVFLVVHCAEYTCPEICSCTALTVTTDCSGNELDYLPEDVYLQVVVLDLSTNNFQAIPNLAKYEDLRTLNMSANKLTTLTKYSLRGLEMLEVLDLSRNLFSQWLDFNRLAFAALKNLKELVLSHNTLGSFPEILVPLSSASLNVLRVANCSIADFHGDILQMLPLVKELDMQMNPLSNVKAQMKSNGLKIWDLTECSVRYIDEEAFAQLPSLYKLLLARNYDLKRFACRSSSLKVLDLTQCNLNGIPSGNLPNLTVLKMQENHLRQLYSYSFNNITGLEILDLSNNAISRIESHSFAKLASIYSINLAYNTISSLDSKALAQNFKLRKLHLSHNYFKSAPNFDIESLKFLDVSSCEIDRINRDALTLMSNLEELNLSKNFISKLPDGLLSDTLGTLDLSHCYISTLNNQTFSEMPLLRSLNLAGNRLTSNVKQTYFPQVTNIRLDDNPWRCDCSADLQDLYEWLMFLDTNPSRLRCQSPEASEGLLWSSACGKTWYPQTSRKDTMWWYSLGLICAMVVMLCGIFTVRHVYQQKERRLREVEEQERNEARERLRRMRQQQRDAREAENRNAPDPRDLQRPPSYNEALLMSSSMNSLSGSRQSLSSNRGRSKKQRPRRKRRKDKSESSTEEARGSRDRHDEDSVEERTTPAALESDF